MLMFTKIYEFIKKRIENEKSRKAHKIISKFVLPYDDKAKVF